MATMGKLEIKNIWNISQTPDKQVDQMNKLMIDRCNKAFSLLSKDTVFNNVSMICSGTFLQSSPVLILFS